MQQSRKMLRQFVCTTEVIQAPTLFLQILLIALFTDPLIFMQCLHLRPKDACESSICTESRRIHVKTVYSLRATGICVKKHQDLELSPANTRCFKGQKLKIHLF
jgi:hypothetical protein